MECTKKHDELTSEIDRVMMLLKETGLVVKVEDKVKSAPQNGQYVCADANSDSSAAIINAGF